MTITPLFNDAPYIPIEDYGIIGDLKTAALLGKKGSLDFICYPEFDSPSVFCANADADKGGRFQIEPLLEEMRETQLYLPDTNVLLNRFLSNNGVAEILNFMVISDPENECEQALVRRVKVVQGEITFRLNFQPRFNYARSEHRVETVDEKVLRFTSEGDDGLVVLLRADIPLTIEDRDCCTEFSLKIDETATFIMEEAACGTSSPCENESYSSEAFKRTCNYWRGWISRCTYNGRWREAVHRPALALKLLTSRKHGSIIAAPCFGFPNELDEGETLQTMYRIDGSRLEGELHLEHLEGYMQSSPVRVGSTNHEQIQLDIFGEVMDSVYLFDNFHTQISHQLWRSLQKLINYLCEH